MQDAQMYLEVVRSRGERGLELSRVYRNLRNKELFLRAYAKLYANKGALTPGTDPTDTADDMSLERIDDIIEALRAGTYRWKPSRRTYIPKKNGKLRPLGIPSWSDKLLQEVMRMVLAAYYEPQFSEMSHGFRPGRGCHTALRSILFNWKGTKWFIEGDIKGCFDNIAHDKLLEIIGRSIKDERFLKLLRGMLDAGYLEDWRYHKTYSGTPQGGVISPLLANIFLNELDTFVEKELTPQYTRGDKRRTNPEYARLTREMRKAKEDGDIERYRAIEKERRTLPCGDPNDPEYRRLKYVRFADDFLLGFVGPKSEANEIKQRTGEFLRTIELTMSEAKTLITHATTGRARFLGYDIFMAKCDSRRKGKRRTVNGTPMLNVPSEVAKEWRTRYMRGGKPYHRAGLLNNSDYDIVMTYNLEFQGLANYYAMAHDVAAKLYPVKWVYLQSLVKTLATKHKRPVTWVYRRHYRRQNNGIKAIVVEVPRENRKPLVAKFGAKPIRFDKKAVINETKSQLLTQRNEMVSRLLANQCELCGSTEDIRVHHIRKLKDLKRRYEGRPDPPNWVVRMIELRRKTLVVCAQCHQAIHAGTYDGPRLK
jgi:group II intron reverse transcriptase/maturase